VKIPFLVYTKNMFEIRVEANFSAAHFLKDFHGKCENLHGHNYRVLAYARGSELGEGGLLIDFGEVKVALHEVCKNLDHVNLNDLEEDEALVFNNNPSAERIAAYIFSKLEILLPHHDAAKLHAVEVFETPTSRARYTR